jgi:general secretion pathway protein F
VLASLRGALREGRSLSSALEAVPSAFPHLYVAMIRAAERTSDLDMAVAQFITYQQEERRLRDQIVNVSIYPLLLLVPPKIY